MKSKVETSSDRPCGANDVIAGTVECVTAEAQKPLRDGSVELLTTDKATAKKSEFTCPHRIANWEPEFGPALLCDLGGFGDVVSDDAVAIRPQCAATKPHD